MPLMAAARAWWPSLAAPAAAVSPRATNSSLAATIAMIATITSTSTSTEPRVDLSCRALIGLCLAAGCL